MLLTPSSECEAGALPDCALCAAAAVAAGLAAAGAAADAESLFFFGGSVESSYKNDYCCEICTYKLTVNFFSISSSRFSIFFTTSHFFERSARF